MATEPNAYSSAWFEYFHASIPATRTAHEAAFVCQQCPLPSFPQLLDACCGMGRHARALTELGYVVTGLERDAYALSVAREKAGGPVYVAADIREYRPTAIFDAVIILSQSFGYFDSKTNFAILDHLGESLRLGGRMILDLWNPEFFRTRQGEHRFNLPVGSVLETKRFVGDRLFTRLDYPDGQSDAFEFQTFSPAQMAKFARPANLTLIDAYSDFSTSTVPCGDKPKVQYILQRF